MSSIRHEVKINGKMDIFALVAVVEKTIGRKLAASETLVVVGAGTDRVLYIDRVDSPTCTVISDHFAPAKISEDDARRMVSMANASRANSKCAHFNAGGYWWAAWTNETIEKHAFEKLGRWLESLAG